MCFWSSCTFIFLDFTIILAQKRPAPARPGRRENEEEKPILLSRLVKNIDFEFIYAEKTHDSSHKIIKRVGEFYVTLICSLGLRNYRMILVVKASKKICHIHYVYARFQFSSPVTRGAVNAHRREGAPKSSRKKWQLRISDTACN